MITTWGNLALSLVSHPPESGLGHPGLVMAEGPGKAELYRTPCSLTRKCHIITPTFYWPKQIIGPFQTPEKEKDSLSLVRITKVTQDSPCFKNPVESAQVSGISYCSLIPPWSGNYFVPSYDVGMMLLAENIAGFPGCPSLCTPHRNNNYNELNFYICQYHSVQLTHLFCHLLGSPPWLHMGITWGKLLWSNNTQGLIQIILNQKLPSDSNV